MSNEIYYSRVIVLVISAASSALVFFGLQLAKAGCMLLLLAAKYPLLPEGAFSVCLVYALVCALCDFLYAWAEPAADMIDGLLSCMCINRSFDLDIAVDAEP